MEEELMHEADDGNILWKKWGEITMKTWEMKERRPEDKRKKWLLKGNEKGNNAREEQLGKKRIKKKITECQDRDRRKKKQEWNYTIRN